MTLHENTSQELRSTIPNNVCRLYTAFGRLASLLSNSGVDYSAVEIAEAGVFNRFDNQPELSHFMDPNLDLDHDKLKNNQPLL